MRHQKHRLTWVCTLGWLVVCLVVPNLAPSPVRGQGHSALEGHPAPAFSGQSASRPGLIRLEQLREAGEVAKNAQGRFPQTPGTPQVLVLNFFATYCQPCIREIPTFNRLARTYHDQSVRFVHVNLDPAKSQQEILAFARQQHMQGEILFPAIPQVTQAYGIRGLPFLVFIGRDGQVYRVMQGFEADLEQQVKRVLAELL